MRANAGRPLADARGDAVVEPAPADGPVPGPPHLADPRALQILSTEHWSLLTARSLVYNETFSRGGMFLTLLSASLVALGFAYQGSGGGGDFLAIVVAVLALDLFVGLATLGRILAASIEELRAVQAMNRVRHAYLEMTPSLAPYFSTGTYDDPGSVLEVYGPEPGVRSKLFDVVHGLTTMPGMVGILDAAIAGALVASAVLALTSDARVALVAGIAAGILSTVVITVWTVRSFSDLGRYLGVRFPRPAPAG
jgi:hypothetical protein